MTPLELSTIPDILGCPRCKGLHFKRQIVFRKFTEEHLAGYTYWYMCPKLQEPVLLRFGDGTLKDGEVTIMGVPR